MKRKDHDDDDRMYVHDEIHMRNWYIENLLNLYYDDDDEDDDGDDDDDDDDDGGDDGFYRD